MKENIRGKVDVVIGRVKRKRKSGNIVEVEPVIVEFGEAQSILCLPPTENDAVFLPRKRISALLLSVSLPIQNSKAILNCFSTQRSDAQTPRNAPLKDLS